MLSHNDPGNKSDSHHHFNQITHFLFQYRRTGCPQKLIISFINNKFIKNTMIFFYSRIYDELRIWTSARIRALNWNFPPLRNYDRQTEQPTDRRTDRVIGKFPTFIYQSFSLSLSFSPSLRNLWTYFSFSYSKRLYNRF